MWSRSATNGASESTESTWLTMSSSRPSLQQQPMWLIGLEPGPELGMRLTHPLATAADLACGLGEQHDDPIRLAELVGSQHDPVSR